MQLALLDLPAAIYVGNTLSMEMRDVLVTHRHVMDGWNQKLEDSKKWDAETETKVIGATPIFGQLALFELEAS